MKEQSIDDRITIKTKSLQQIESLKHQINVKQSESQKQSDLMKQLATRVKEEDIKRLESEYNEKIVSLRTSNYSNKNTPKLWMDEYNEKTVSLRNAHAKEMAELRQSLYDEKMVELAQKDRVIQDMKHEQQTKEEKHNKAMDGSEQGRDNVIKYPNRFKGQST
eukprot:189763_1